MKKILFTIIGIVALTLPAFADEVSFVISAPEAVEAGQYFRVSYTVNRGNVKEPRVSFSDFEVLSGPNRSTSVRQSNYNGVVETVHTVTFNYTLMASKEGSYTLPSATIEVDGKQYKSNSATIKVLPADKASQASGNRSGRDGNRRTASTNISNDELFMRAILSKTAVYEQEAVLLTFKVYSAVNLSSVSPGAIDIKDCLVQEVELPQNKSGNMEHYNGRNYIVYTWRQFVLFPQKSGELEIPSVKFDAVAAVETNMGSADPFDFFFNGGPRYLEVKKELHSPKLKLNVEALPAGRPDGFSGGVGQFGVTTTLSTNELKANEAVTLRMVISGVGNLKLIKTPEVNFPESFEVYDPKIENRFKLTNSGFQGSKVIEYLAIPRHAGEYTIPSVQFSYFNTEKKQYETIATDSYTLSVAKGEGGGNETVASFVGKEELRLLGQDIRYIKSGNVKLAKPGDYFFFSLGYWLCYIVPFLMFIAYILLHYKQMKENADISRMRTKKANSTAVKRLKVARKLLKENNKAEFYDEILKALWGYVSDKLSIPVSRLTKDNVAAELSAKSVGKEIISELENVLGECEFARYAPGDAAAAMDNVYKKAMEIIDKMENSIKR